MSTVVVVKKDGVAAIGADTLTKLGGTRESADYIEDASKILRVGECYFAIVGHASFKLVLASYFAGEREPPRLACSQDVFEMARELHRVLKDDYFLNPKEDEDDEFESSQFHCLIASPHGIFGLYALRSVQEYSRFYAFGSGCHLALGAMHATYASDASAEAVARAGLAAAAEFDDCTGLPLEIHAFPLRAR